MPRESASAIQTMFREPRHLRGITRTLESYCSRRKPGDIESRIGIVFTHEYDDSQLLLVLFGNLNRLDHRSDHVHGIVLEGDDALRTGAHTDAATPATIRIRFGRSLFVFVQRAEGALFGASFALSAALQEKAGVGHISGSGMHCQS